MKFFKDAQNWKQEISAIFMVVGIVMFLLSFLILGEPTIWLIIVCSTLLIPLILGTFWKMKVPALLILVLSFFFIFCALKDKEYAHGMRCMNNLKTLAMAIFIYADDSDGHLPTNKTWQAILSEHYRDVNINFCCPSASEDEVSYVYLGDDWMTLPAENIARSIPLFYEARPRHCLQFEDKINVAFMDGSATVLTKDKLEDCLKKFAEWTSTQSHKIPE